LNKEECLLKKLIYTDAAPVTVGPYSQAVMAGDFLFVSGQIAVHPETGKMVEGGIENQVERVIKNIGSILEAAGGDLSCIVKTTVFLASMDDFAAMNEIYRGYFTEDPPARAAFEVSRLPLGAQVEIEAVAYLG
jgi:2-iminobutanoate/2-iminopropanoate deaminase